MNKKQIMKNAVGLAKKMEGNWNARMKMALKIVWRLAKKGVAYEIVEKKENEWKKHGHHRIYIEGKMIAYFEGFRGIEFKEITFSGYYNALNGKVAMQGGNASFKDEIFAALREIGKSFKPVETKQSNVIEGFFPAKFSGRDAETGERFDAGDYIFYCESNQGYCLAHNA